jgi:hypothetical protein
MVNKGVSAKSLNRRRSGGHHTGLTRIRLQHAIYFCLHRGSLPENTAGDQPGFREKLVLKKTLKEQGLS